MAAASFARRSGAPLALAALSVSASRPIGAGALALNRCMPRRAPTTLPSRSMSSSSSDADGSDPALSNEDDYEWLKRSRPVRIRARMASPYGGGGRGGTNAMGSSPSVTKIVHFQRHGQGTHNELYKEWTERTGEPLDLSETDPEKNPLLLDHVVDAPLTRKGRDQCTEQRSSAAGILDGVELVVCSPLVRALETAHITFEDHLPYNSRRDVKWMAHEGIREELGTLMCNKRRPLRETELQFPEVDYAYIPCGDKDVMWDDHARMTSEGNGGMPKRESTEDMSHRAYNFLVDFLYGRPEREIAVVGHSAWLLAMTGAVLDVVEEDAGMITPMFSQAELRSMDLVFMEQ